MAYKGLPVVNLYKWMNILAGEEPRFSERQFVVALHVRRAPCRILIAVQRSVRRRRDPITRSHIPPLGQHFGGRLDHLGINRSTRAYYAVNELQVSSAPGTEET